MQQNFQPNSETQEIPVSGLISGQAANERVPVAPVARTEETERIEKLCGYLRPNHPVRAIARSVLNGEPQPLSSVQKLLATLEIVRRRAWFSRDNLWWLAGRWRVHPEHTEREIAAWALGQLQLPPALEKRAGAALADTLDCRRPADVTLGLINVGRGFGRSYLFVLALIACLYLVQTLFMFRYWPNDLYFSPLYILFGMLMRLLMSGLMAAFPAFLFSPLFLAVNSRQNRFHLGQMRAAAAGALGKHPAPESLDALAQAAADGSSDVNAASLHALYEVLPTVTEESYEKRHRAQTVPHLSHLLRNRDHRLHRKAVNDFLNSAPYRLRLLETLERIGDTRAIEDVEQIAEHDSRVQVRNAAARVLGVLVERQRRETDRKILLRGSSAAETSGSETLLRPAASQADSTPKEELLRAHSPEPETQQESTSESSPRHHP